MLYSGQMGSEPLLLLRILSSVRAGWDRYVQSLILQYCSLTGVFTLRSITAIKRLSKDKLEERLQCVDGRSISRIVKVTTHGR